MTALATADLALYARLLNVPAAGGIWQDVAPEGTASPWVVYQLQAPGDVTTLNGSRLWLQALYVVKAVGQFESYDPLEPVADAIDVALHGLVEDDLWSVVRVEPLRLWEEAGGRIYRHLGGVYQVSARP